MAILPNGRETVSCCWSPPYDPPPAASPVTCRDDAKILVA